MILRTVRTLCVVLVSACAVSAYANGKMAANEKTCSGTITAVDAKEKVIKVQRFNLFNKTFVMGNNCALAFSDKREASLEDFRPGQKVEISYIDASGVLVADRIAQEEMRFSGQVQALDRNAHTLTVRHWVRGKAFTIAGNCNVILNGDAKGGLDDVKVGNRVTIIYELPDNRPMARQIEQKSIMFVGTLDAINLPDHSVSAASGRHGDTVFHLADDCAIMVNGKPEGRLNDLRLGRKYELSYDSVNGVNVVNRIALVEAPEKTEMSEHASRTGASTD